MSIDNNYFEEKNITIDLIESYFKKHPLDEANIGRMYWELVEGAQDTELLTISEIIFYHAIWKLAGGLRANAIERIKKLTNEIIQSKPTFTHLNADEYNDFIKMVKELSESKIDILAE